MVQLIGNLLVMVASYAYSCRHENYEKVFAWVYLGISVISTNVLCHRYLLEKARVMCSL